MIARSISRSSIALAALLVSGCRHQPEIKMAPPPKVELAPPPVPVDKPPPPAARPEVVLADRGGPNVALRFAFRAGSVDDPPGREGLTALAAAVMAGGGTEKMNTAELSAALYPIAGAIEAQTDAEMTVFIGQVHKEAIARFLPLMLDVVAHPRWDDKELDRLRADAINDIERRLRTSDDENLGKAALDLHLYAGHPYGHYAGGTVSSLRAITLAELKAHAAKVFTRARLIVGVAGAIDAGDAGATAQIERAIAALPAGDDTRVAADVPHLKPLLRRAPRVLIVEKETGSTAISMGYPIGLRRGDADWPAMRVAVSAFGEHRQFIGRLMERLRGVRGLNYGDYAYLEHFEQDGSTTYPEPNLPRSLQTFSIWIRPVEAKNGAFALRAALFETRKLAAAGLSDEEVERAKKFLAGYLPLFVQTDLRRLGFAIDDRFYKTPDFLDHTVAAIGRLTPAEVNAAIRKWIEPDKLRIVIVTKDGAAMKRALIERTPSPITYDSPMPKDVLDEDKQIESLDLGLRDEEVRVVKASELFEK